MTDRGDCAAAMRNLRTVFKPNLAFPADVFGSDWGDAYFFDSDWMFEGPAVTVLKNLMSVEDATCVCFANLDRLEEEEHQFYVHSETTDAEFEKLLVGEDGGGLGLGWHAAMDRFGCISDRGEWCIYCERHNDIAVLAFRSSELAKLCSPAVRALKAASIEEALAQSISWAFSSRGLPEHWRQALLRHYGSKR